MASAAKAFEEPVWGLPGADPEEPNWGMPGEVICPDDEAVDWDLLGYEFKRKIDAARDSEPYRLAFRHLTIVANSVVGLGRSFQALTVRTRAMQLAADFDLSQWAVAALVAEVPALIAANVSTVC